MKEYESMITPDTKTYWKQLAGIPWSHRGELRTKLVPWVFTNDHGFSDIMPGMVDKLNSQDKQKRPRVAVLSGVGSLLNIAPYVDVDFFVSVDRNSFVLDQVRRMVETVKDAETPEEYQYQYQLNTFFQDLREMDVDPEPYWNWERESFGGWHFLADNVNYQQTRDTLLRTPVYYSQGNFTHEPYVQGLGKALQGANVSYASFTDLGEWYPTFFDVVHHLPFSDDSIVAWSTNKEKDGFPVAKYSQGLNNYLVDAKQQLEGVDVSYFKAHT